MRPIDPNKRPSYRLHRASGQAVVTLNGVDVYLGRHNSRESQERYDKVIAEWLNRGRQLPLPPDSSGYTVAMLVDAFVQHIGRKYTDANGQTKKEFSSYKPPLAALVEKFGKLPAEQFDSLALIQLRQEFISKNWCRKHIAEQLRRVKNCFAYGVEYKLIKNPSNYCTLGAVKPLGIGEFGARESEKVTPVPRQQLEAILPLCSPQIAALLRLQLLTGARPGEFLIARGVDLDTTGDVWLYRPSQHKNKHRGHKRVIDVGPKAQEVIRPFLRNNLSEFLFQPAEALAWHRQQRHKLRVTPLSRGNSIGTNRKRNPKRTPGLVYTESAFYRAIQRACEKAFPAPADLTDPVEIEQWKVDHSIAPNRVRHTYGTEKRKKYGLEATSKLLGHRSMKVSERYCDDDPEREEQRKIVREVG